MTSMQNDYLDYDEVMVEMVPANDSYPGAVEIATAVTEDSSVIFDDSGAEEIEVARGGVGELMAVEDILIGGPDIQLTDYSEPEHEEESKIDKKTRTFIESIKHDGEWARSLPNVKLNIHANPYLTKERVSDLLTHCITKVNHRPRSLIVTSKSVTLQDLADLIKLSFSNFEDERAMNNSMIRLYSKNTTTKLLDLAKALQSACSELDDVRLTYNDIFAELKTSKDSAIRYRTSSIRDYWSLEQHAKDMNLRVQTTFNIKRRSNNSREIVVSWYDEPKEGYGRATYIQFNHMAYREVSNRVSFSPSVTMHTVDVPPGEKMFPVSCMNPEVKDLIAFLEKTKPYHHKPY